MAENNQKITQPTEEAELALLKLIEDSNETVRIGNKKYKIRGLRKGTRLKVSSILLNGKIKDSENTSDKEMVYEDKVMAKCAAAYILNSWWTLRFMWGLVWSIYWRYLYYVKQYTDSDYYELMQLCKKKAEKQTSAYTMNIMLLTATKVTTMTMTRAEVERIRLEKSTEQLGALQKSSQP